MRRKTAKEILIESFRELADTRKINRITVREITENCGYSPATFYRHFKDKYDLITQDYTTGMTEIMNGINQNSKNLSATLTDAAEYFSTNRNYLANLFLHTNGMDSFIQHMREIHYEALKGAVTRISGTEPDEKTKIYIRTYVLGTVQLTCEWILGNYSLTPAELAEVYENALPGPLKHYFD